MIRVWEYWIVRPKALFVVAQLLVLGGILLHVAWSRVADAVPAAGSGALGTMLVLLSCQAAFYAHRLDERIVDSTLRAFLTVTAKSVLAGLIVAGLMFWLFPFLSPGFSHFLGGAVLSLLLLLALRPLIRQLVKRRKMVEGMLILGTGELAQKFYLELVNGKKPQERRVLSEGKDLDAAGGEAQGVNVQYSQLGEITRRQGISRIVVADTGPHGREELATALLDCKMRGVEIERAADSYERLSGKVWLEAVRPEALIFAAGFTPSKLYLRLKTLMDFVGALAMVVAAAPVLLLVSAAIKLTSPGPVLFRQVRVGQGGRHFVLYKFRSMREDAEANTGPTWAGDGDPRITPVGHILRKFRLDELPQAFNVLKGEMSLVGPRPERPYFVNLLGQRIPFYNLRHYVKPGITGWAQVLYPYGASIEDAYEKLQYDLYYAKKMSLGMDLRVLLKTVKVVLFGRGR
jgi:sugar transferase (PEP-CTERM system associated)